MYDPHLAPLVEAFIAQHRAQESQGYRPISSTPVASQASSGRSSALDNGAEKLRRRHPAEMYELDETRILQDECDAPPPPYAVRRRHVHTRQAPPAVQRETPVTPAEKVAPQPETEKPDVLISLDVAQPAEAEPAPAAIAEKAAETAPAESSREPEEKEKVREVEPSPPSPATVRSGAASELFMPMPQAARPTIPQILQDEALLSPSTVSSVLSSPQLLGSSELGEDDVISLSGVSNNTASYVDAETYTPRTLSPMSPSDFSLVSSRAISPEALIPDTESAPSMAQVLSQSGWDSESLRSDSEWEVLSNRR